MKPYCYKKEIKLLIVLSIVLFSCRTFDTPTFEIYKGPENITENISAIYTDSARVKAHIQSPVQQTLINDDTEYPKGLDVKFYDDEEALENTLICNYAIKTSKTGVWKITGNVEVVNIKKQEKLNTEELYWDENGDRIWTDKYVIIETKDQTIEGTGLESNQNFSEYEILNPTGTFDISGEKQ